jgi:hypothetical protein
LVRQHEQLQAEIEARLRGLESRVDQHDYALGPSVDGEDWNDGGDSDGAEAAVPQSAERRYATLDDWVAQHFARLYARPLGGQWRWCARWRDHPEAVDRLQALWNAWETIHRDPGLGLATWYTQYLDPQLAVLLGNTGTFARCVDDRHEPPAVLPVPSQQ